MQTRLTSILIGIILILGTGFLVYTTKKPSVLPIEDSTTGTVGITQTFIPTSSSAQNTVGKHELDDDNNESEDGTATSQLTTIPASTNPIPQTGTSSGGITLSQISQHNSRASCWSAINGSVYDLTSWIPNHPGGEQTILSICGIDGSNNYNAQHSGSSRPAIILGGFKIGELAK